MGGPAADIRAACPEFGLCRRCAARIASRGSPGHFRHADSAKCHVCGGLMGELAELAKHAAERVSGYDYETFSVGATLKVSILDRDDYMRSRAGAAGAVSIKAALTGEVARLISGQTGKRLDRDDPDITILVDTRLGSCEVRSRHVVVEMRYTKTCRGLPQKRTVCGACGGAGCNTCGFAGAGQSVEGVISAYLLGVMGGTDVRFTWVGGEDRESLVLGSGRLVYARVRNPAKSADKLPESVSLNGICITSITSGVIPQRLPPFKSAVRMLVRCGDVSNLRRVKGLAGSVRVGTDSGRTSTRTVGVVRYRRMGGDSFRMTAEVEGGHSRKTAGERRGRRAVGQLAAGGRVRVRAVRLFGCSGKQLTRGSRRPSTCRSERRESTRGGPTRGLTAGAQKSQSPARPADSRFFTSPITSPTDGPPRPDKGCPR